MLKIILGAVALGATGYGVHKYFELEEEYNNLNDDVKRIKERNKNFGSYFNTSKEVFNKEQKSVKSILDEKLTSSLQKIVNLNESIKIVPDKEIDIYQREERITSLSFLNNFIETLSSYNSVLKNSKEQLIAKGEKLEKLIEKSNDFKTYSKKNRRFIKELLELKELLDIATQDNLINKEKIISDDMRRAFYKLEDFLQA